MFFMQSPSICSNDSGTFHQNKVTSGLSPSAKSPLSPPANHGGVPSIQSKLQSHQKEQDHQHQHQPEKQSQEGQESVPKPQLNHHQQHKQPPPQPPQQRPSQIPTNSLFGLQQPVITTSLFQSRQNTNISRSRASSQIQQPQRNQEPQSQSQFSPQVVPPARPQTEKAELTADKLNVYTTEEEKAKTMSYKSTSQASLFGNNNTRRTQTVEQKVVFSSDEDFSDDSDWSSLSDDSDDDDAQDELHFEKLDNYRQDNKQHLKRSLLSGLFLDQMNHSGGSSSSSPTASQQQQSSNHVNQQNQFQSQPQRMKSPNFIYASGSSNAHHNIDPLELNSMHGARPLNTTKSNNIAAMATLSSPPNNPRSLLKKQSSDNHQHQMNRSGSNSTTHAVSKSALSLTSFFANNRRPTGNQEFNGHYDKYHQSNAPATAATLLTTALSTHMFLPTMNMHKQQQQHILPAKEQILLQQQQQHAQLRGRTSDRDRVSTHRLPSLSEEIHDGAPSSVRRGIDSSSGSNSSDYRQQQQIQQRNHRDGHHSTSGSRSGSRSNVKQQEKLKSPSQSIDIRGTSYNSMRRSTSSQKRLISPESKNTKNNGTATNPPSIVNGNANVNSKAKFTFSPTLGASQEQHGRSNSSQMTLALPTSEIQTRIEMLSKELPSNLLESINNENRVLYRTSSSRKLTGINGSSRLTPGCYSSRVVSNHAGSPDYFNYKASKTHSHLGLSNGTTSIHTTSRNNSNSSKEVSDPANATSTTTRSIKSKSKQHADRSYGVTDSESGDADSEVEGDDEGESEDDDDSDDNINNRIANGMMGNKLKLISDLNEARNRSYLNLQSLNGDRRRSSSSSHGGFRRGVNGSGILRHGSNELLESIDGKTNGSGSGTGVMVGKNDSRVVINSDENGSDALIDDDDDDGHENTVGPPDELSVYGEGEGEGNESVIIEEVEFADELLELGLGKIAQRLKSDKERKLRLREEKRLNGESTDDDDNDDGGDYYSRGW
ncbi:unnamed protein product [Ambrosiozyma monospora]|uniref:Unnamed protein product n=1 Tax=Ambrosiozyma monospora TaxID=43982 RepID=A0A9W6YUN2_AMBMO|nr:unnamed protein product [Ambrosiozyma monospora]